ncbi:MAG: ATP-binding protein [Holosporaceae bacterium]|jgi:AAA15 family ATPase/GTPase|nr:ATP-binding protein [Holosporaceae bacterium]
MLIEFSVENYKSFKEKVEFSMIATNENRYSGRVFALPENSGILQIASIYGGNASGKSNFISALKTLQAIVLGNSMPQAAIAVDPFRLDNECLKKESTFDIKISINDKIYRYVVSATNFKIVGEKLVQICSDDSEKELYERNGSEVLIKTENIGEIANEQEDLLNFLAKSKAVRDNQTFLRTTLEFNVKSFLPVWNWFRSSLSIIDPNINYQIGREFIDESSDANKELNRILQSFDTGISRIGSEQIDIQLPSNVVEQVYNLPEGRSVTLFPTFANGDLIHIMREGGKIIPKKAVSFHTKSDGEEAFFGLANESDGSKRVIGLLPAFMDIMSSNSNKVLLIDEVDRSLHTDLVSSLIERYLSCCSKKTKSQLIVTTHNPLLLGQDIFRRDEVWFTERGPGGHSDMFSLCSFEDNGEDMKNYLQGRFGGIPNVMRFILEE